MSKINFSGVRHTLRMTVISLCLASFCMQAVAQKQIASRYWHVLPKKFSYTEKPQIYTEGDDNAPTTVAIYDETLAQVKTFDAIEYVSGREIVEERRFMPGEYTDIEKETSTAYVSNLDEATVWAKDYYGAESHTKNGDLHTYLPLELRVPENGYDMIEYVKCTYREGSTMLTIHYMIRLPKYSDWTVIYDETWTNNSLDWAPSVVNCDADVINDDVECGLTQTLFNTDEKYEYLCPITELSAEPYVSTWDEVYLYNESFPTKRSKRYFVEAKGWKVVNEDGTTVCTFPATASECNIVLLGGKTYLAFCEENGTTFYEINAQTNSVQKVLTAPVRIYPRMVRGRSNDFVTIEAGGELSNSRREVVVTDMNGRRLVSRAIPAGESRVQVETGQLSAGVYNFTVYANGQRVDNGKIIVR